MSEYAESDIRKELQEIKAEQRETNRKIDRLLIGNDGVDGLLSRMTRLETRLNGVVYLVGWVIVGIVGYVIAAITHLTPSSWFKSH